MILLDTNVVIYASEESGPYADWARDLISTTVAGEGAALDAVSLAELQVGAVDPGSVAITLKSWGIVLVDVPQIASESAARAYREYRDQSGKETPAMALPYFFIGAHAEVLGWSLATVDKGRFTTYFPDVDLIMP